MTLSARDRRALLFLGLALIAALLYAYWPASTPAASVAASLPLDQVEQRLDRLRQVGATVPAKEGVLKTVAAQLATRERGLLQADTAAQAQAQVIQILRGIASSESIPVEIRSTEIGAVTPFGEAYGSVNISVQMECRIEQLINMLSAIGSRTELIAPSDFRVTSGNPKDKTLGVRLTLTALVPRKLVPQKKGTL